MSNLLSDLPGPVDVPTGPTEVLHVDEAPGSIIAEADPSVASIVGAPVLKEAPVVASDGETVLFVEAPWYIKNFSPSIEGCPEISSDGTSVPSALVDQAISIGADHGVTIVKR